jgi:hypothetical protein
MKKSEWTGIGLGCAAMMALVVSASLTVEQRNRLVDSQIELAECEKSQQIESCEDLRKSVFRQSATLLTTAPASSYVQTGMLYGTQQASSILAPIYWF